jgi:hypothetical protein
MPKRRKYMQEREIEMTKKDAIVAGKGKVK